MKFKINIFIASPSDVTNERNIVEKVCKKLEKDYKKHISIKPISWKNYSQSYHKDAQLSSGAKMRYCNSCILAQIWNLFAKFNAKSKIGCC